MIISITRGEPRKVFICDLSFTAKPYLEAVREYVAANDGSHA
jgi:hypothetical protein